VANKTIVSLSGGLDSTTLLYYQLAQGDKVQAVSFYYGQKHARELRHAESICRGVGVDSTMFNLASIQDAFMGSCLTDKGIDVPADDGFYNTKAITVVPNRNTVFLSIAVAKALSDRYNQVAYAAHASDYEIYPDCRPIFVEKFQEVVDVANQISIKIVAPFLHKDKADIVKLGIELGVPFEKTWSCYRGGSTPCGVCSTCIERNRAFEENGLADPAL
jgi:7-cyano-7-deazaguanine synthase